MNLNSNMCSLFEIPDKEDIKCMVCSFASGQIRRRMHAVHVSKTKHGIIRKSVTPLSSETIDPTCGGDVLRIVFFETSDFL